MEDAVAEYARLRGESDAWMLGRFVCPANRLAELAERWKPAAGPPLAVIALASAGADRGELAERAHADAAAIAAFAAETGRRIVDQIEARLPAAEATAPDPELVAETLAGLERALAPAALVPLLLALEVSVPGSAPERVAAAAQGIALFNAGRAAAGALPACLKIRCGGLEPAAIPSTAELAAAIAHCRDERVAIKATQGLHHPTRRLDPALGVETHGFLNLLAAGVLARAYRLDASAIAAILDEHDLARFSFDDEGFEWGAYRVGITDIAAGRRHAVVSFGSCSFAEPRDDLRAAGLLDPTE